MSERRFARSNPVGHLVCKMGMGRRPTEFPLSLLVLRSSKSGVGSFVVSFVGKSVKMNCWSSSRLGDRQISRTKLTTKLKDRAHAPPPRFFNRIYLYYPTLDASWHAAVGTTKAAAPEATARRVGGCCLLGRSALQLRCCLGEGGAGYRAKRAAEHGGKVSSH